MFLGIDIGTSAIKALLVDGDENGLATATVAVATSRPQALWSEQDPDEWWRATTDAVAQLRTQAGPAWSAVRAIGLSGQMHGAVLLGATGRPLRPAIIWNDGRSHREASRLNFDLAEIGTIAGVIAMPGFTAPKLIWLRQNEPEILRDTAHLLLPKDYVRLQMTGTLATDMSDAAGSLLLDCGARDWSDAILSQCGVSRRQLPELLEGSAPSGHLRDELASAWGLPKGIVVAAGAGDAAAGAIGVGAIAEGDAFISLGTSAQYFIARDGYHPAPEHLIHTFCHGLPQRWFQMAAILNGASSVAWAVGATGGGDIGALLAEVEKGYEGPSPVLFLPYLTGERTPHNDAHAKGVFFGLTPVTTRHDLVLAALDGVTLSLADCQDLLAETGGLPTSVAVVGGGARSSLWMRILASALGREMVLYEGSDVGPALGAARLARIALTGEDPDAVCRKPAIAARFAPDAALHAAYGRRLQRYRDLYAALRPAFREA
ncbi:MAG: xylulokinase [Alphaproteobacteria bacterium]|nr:xylulokinase [Alphaproteobacteria bacterium]